ncbi:S9 family peptidase [Rhodoligotrophos defluvii]|uniref:S9 family peptidase n=1 Tax=Rhodoligotrophos defluvii TaxID=2561934 RepID=UPI0010CA1138|nr:prolyl oligopeptidase family serine peptidase [Rhodoligotrophos defluvii]
MDATKTRTAFGTWPSPVTADMVAGRALRFGMVQAEGETLYWTESRPQENGRMTVMRSRMGAPPRDMTPAPYSARSRVHEYGGGEFLTVNGAVYFSNGEDHNIYVGTVGGVVPLTTVKYYRFADFTYDRWRRRLIAVAERHGGTTMAEPKNLLVEIPLDGRSRGYVTSIIDGADFYASPRVSRDGRRLAWVEWDLPGMPWDESRLMVAELEGNGRLGTVVHVAGGSGSCVFQPEWGSDGMLYFVDDRTGWGNLYAWDGEQIFPLAPREGEFGLPLWSLGARTYAEINGGRLFATFYENGMSQAAVIDPRNGQVQMLDFDLRDITLPTFAHGTLYAFGTTDTTPRALIRIDIGEQVSAPAVIRPSLDVPLASGDISEGQLITVRRERKEPVYALFYPPTNRAHAGRALETPPMIVTAHGGPTAMADRGLKPRIQYWTSRGFAVLDVDYAGSWGYGRHYRDLLNGQWGVRDVQDVIAAAKEVVARGLADGDRMAIVGSSAGGFTVLCALAFADVFKAGVSSYGVGDLDQLLRETHKFESGYLYALTGTSVGATEKVFEARSPVFHAANIKVPMMFFQGTDDKVVPPEQSRVMVAKLKARGVPVGYMEFEGEGHGFRNPEVVKAALLAEHAFYARVFKLRPPEPLPDITLFNEDQLP